MRTLLKTLMVIFALGAIVSICYGLYQTISPTWATLIVCVFGFITTSAIDYTYYTDEQDKEQPNEGQK